MGEQVDDRTDGTRGKPDRDYPRALGDGNQMKISDGGGNITPIRAVLIRHTRLRFADGGLIEVKLWGVPPSPDKLRGYKYSNDFLKGVARCRGER
jgi:hypothetical protein